MKLEKIDKRQAIVDAATKLFCEFGFEGTTTRQISRESGANMAMINYYFGSKEGVFMEIMSERISGFRIHLNSINQNKISSLNKLHLVIEGYVNRILPNAAFHRMMYREFSLMQRPDMYDKIRNAMEQNFLVIEEIILEGVNNGNFKKVDVRMLISTIVGTISNVAISPAKPSANAFLDMESSEEKNLIKQRLINYLKDITTAYLTINNDTQIN
jgi:AcrR family transcriptional regulator